MCRVGGDLYELPRGLSRELSGGEFPLQDALPRDELRRHFCLKLFQLSLGESIWTTFIQLVQRVFVGVHAVDERSAKLPPAHPIDVHAVDSLVYTDTEISRVLSFVVVVVVVA